MRILFATIGSLGDLHPCLALALELKRRGHSVRIASTNFYQSKIEALGLEFRPLRPHWDPTNAEMIRRCENIRTGFETLLRKIILPELRDTYDDLFSAAQEADLLIAGEMVFPAPLVAEKLGLPWVSLILSPASFLSAQDPSVFPNAPGFIHIRKLGAPAYRAALEFSRRLIRHWWRPVRRLRRQLELSPGEDPIFKDKFSPDLVLALFSPALATAQPDWPASTLQTGFVYFDRPAIAIDPLPELTAFLAGGDAPIVFTLGSTAVNNAGNFYQQSAEAARHLGRRALLLVGKNSVLRENSPRMLALPYAPYAEVFPHAAAIVHQGGSGTTGEAMRAGKLMLIVPYGWDQPDNGARVQRIGAGLCLTRSGYSATTAAAALKLILEDPQFTQSALALKLQLQREDGLNAACDAIEAAS